MLIAVVMQRVTTLIYNVPQTSSTSHNAQKLAMWSHLHAAHSDCHVTSRFPGASAASMIKATLLQHWIMTTLVIAYVPP